MHLVQDICVNVYDFENDRVTCLFDIGLEGVITQILSGGLRQNLRSLNFTLKYQLHCNKQTKGLFFCQVYTFC